MYPMAVEMLHLGLRLDSAEARPWAWSGIRARTPASVSVRRYTWSRSWACNVAIDVTRPRVWRRGKVCFAFAPCLATALHLACLGGDTVALAALADLYADVVGDAG
jgi:hypothetical protein